MRITKLQFMGVVLLAGVTAISAHAQQWSSWTPFGGNTTYHSFGGQTGTSWTPFGGNTTYHSFGGQTGTSWTPFGGNTTYHSGSLFRGEDGKSILFSDAKFAEKFPEDAWLDAADARNVPLMTQLAWTMKGVETVLGSKDAKTTSAMMFDAAAQMAVAQGNAEALRSIVSLCPECAKYNEEMASLTKTRGAGTFVPGLPQLVLPPASPAELAGFLKGLAPYQVPLMPPELFSSMLPQTAAPDVANICTLVNQGRITKSPRMLALAAVELTMSAGASSVYLEPKRLLEEAAELAVLLADRNALEFIVDIYGREASPLADKEKASLYLEEAKAMSGSRGVMSRNVLKMVTAPPFYFDPTAPETMPWKHGDASGPERIKAFPE